MICSRCGGWFDPFLAPGALFFGKPDDVGRVQKYHLDQFCSEIVEAEITGKHEG